MPGLDETTPLSVTEKAVFGADAKRGPDGKIIEQGHGAVAQKTERVLKIEAPAEEVAKVNLAKLEERAALEKANAEAEPEQKTEEVFLGSEF